MSFSAALRRNVLILSACQALMLSGSSLIVATSALTGLSLATNSLWATLPLSCMFAGTWLTTFPASLLMKSIGRRAGFMIGPLAGLVGAAIAIYAITERDFWMFCVGSFLIGRIKRRWLLLPLRRCRYQRKRVPQPGYFLGTGRRCRGCFCGA